jgi:hypothetical protein
VLYVRRTYTDEAEATADEMAAEDSVAYERQEMISPRRRADRTSRLTRALVKDAMSVVDSDAAETMLEAMAVVTPLVAAATKGEKQDQRLIADRRCR